MSLLKGQMIEKDQFLEKIDGMYPKMAKVAKHLVFVSSRSVYMRASSAFSVCILFEEGVFIFQFLNNKIHSCVLFDIILHFIFQKLKNKHTFLKEYTN